MSARQHKRKIETGRSKNEAKGQGPVKSTFKKGYVGL